MRDTKKETFLALNMTMNFFNTFYVGVMIFNIFTRSRNDESYLTPTYNYIELVVFVLLILFYLHIFVMAFYSTHLLGFIL